MAESATDNLECLRQADKPSTLFSLFQDFGMFCRKRGWMVSDQEKGTDTIWRDLGSSFIVLNPYGIWRAFSDAGVDEVPRFQAAGSGADHALGYLAIMTDDETPPRDLAVQAVRSACILDAACGGPIKVAYRGVQEIGLKVDLIEI